ncbi:MAG TPA: hypothetical protein VED37_04130 [Ktedonobacteraceae bacterium]|nr:hypothetical protein [Ktedonobacteraceae bacterium]
MKRHSAGFFIGLVVSIIVGFAVVVVVWFALGSIQGLGYTPSAIQATITGPNSATINLAAFPDSMACHPDAPDPQSGWVSYCPTTLDLPPNSVITVVIKQYDSATGLYNDFFNTVQGTMGGVALYNNKPMSKLDTAKIAHTFTIQSLPDETNPIFVSVPLLGVPDNAPNNVTVNGNPYPTPTVNMFQFRTGPAGHTYIWHCYVPCGSDMETPFGFSGPMATTGFMAGTINVTNY